MAKKDEALGENGAYWAQRMRFYEQACARKNLKITAEIDAAFSKASSDIERDLEYWYGRLAKNNGISLAAARKLLDADELAEFKWSVDEYMAKARQSGNGKWLKELENASARVHISRLDAMKISMRNTLESAFGAENDLVTKMAAGTYRDAVKHTAAEMEKLFKAEFNIGEIDDEKIHKLIRKPWTPDARTFSDRIWAKKNEMINALQEELTRGCIYGRSLDETIARMEKFVDGKFKNAKYAARRIVVTESAYFRVLGTRDELAAIGVEEFQVDLPIDAKTCEICREMNGRVFPMSEFSVGLNAPPFHPNCENGSIIPVMDEDFEEALREAREKKSGEGLTNGGNGGTIKESKQKSEIRHSLEKANIEYRKVENLKTPLSIDEIISRVGGGDTTKGACSSAAFAYIGNRNGLDVLDFRGGKSLEFFSKTGNIKRIADLPGINSTILKSNNDFKAVDTLLRSMECGKEYYLATGAHAAIIRRLEKGFQYLELQDPKSNGFKALTTHVLKKRFGCKKSHSSFGVKMESSSILIDVSSFNGSTEFKQILGYINTSGDMQRKGVSGSVK